jgi:CRISPR system Cascade subunit CasC
MRLIELHILQSFPVSCLNRDDLGAPKTAIFGGVNRARISSQCLKRAIRLAMKEICPELCQGERSRLIVDPLGEALREEIRNSKMLPEAVKSMAYEAAELFAREICDSLAKMDAAAEKAKGVRKVRTLMFLSPAERRNAALAVREELEKKSNGDKGATAQWLELAVRALRQQTGNNPDGDKSASGQGESGKKSGKGDKKGAKEIGEIVKKGVAAIREAGLTDAGDIALFGRMVANDPTLNVEGAAMFSHALSTHRADNDIDFFTAVDDRQREDPAVADEDRAGSGMMGTLEFTSATYYRYVAANVGMLEDGDHLEKMSKEDRRKLLDAFVRASLLAVPSARKNSMNASTLPAFVLGVYREKGHPVQLVNAFEEPVKADRDGYIRKSREALEKEFGQLKSVWGIRPEVEVRIPSDGMSLDRFCEELLKHV